MGQWLTMPTSDILLGRRLLPGDRTRWGLYLESAMNHWADSDLVVNFSGAEILENRMSLMDYPIAPDPMEVPTPKISGAF